MKKNKKIHELIAVTLLMLPFMLMMVCNIQENRDPSHDGVPLSDWLAHLAWGEDEDQEQAKEAVQAIGTNGIPLLLKYLAEKNSTPRYLLDSNVAGLFGQQAERPYIKRWKATAGFKALGPAGQPAIPQLLVLLESGDSAYHAAIALGATRSPEALVLFTNMMVLPQENKRVLGLLGLGAMNTDARFLTGQIMKIARDDQAYIVRSTAFGTLADIGAEEEVVPFLLDRFQTDTNRQTRLHAARALGAFPKQAALIRPVLETAAQDSDKVVQRSGELGIYVLTNNLAKLEKGAAKTNLTENPAAP